MNLTIKNYNERYLLLAEGTVSKNDFTEIAEQLEKLPATASKYVLLDCSDTNHVIQSNTGFSGFVSHLLQLRTLGAHITLFGCDQQVGKLLQLLRLDHLFQQAPTLDDAYIGLTSTFKPSPATTLA